MRRALPALLLASCYATTTAPVELGRIYAVDAPQARQRLPSTLFVPGILGSRITDPETGLAYWGSVLGDEIIAAALIDRVPHHCHLGNIRGNSYRMREHTALRQAMQDLDTEPLKRGRRSRSQAD